VPLSWFPALPAHIAAAASGPDERRDVDARAALWLLDPLMRALDAGADALALDQASAAAVTASNQPAALRPWPPLVAWPMRLLEALVPAHAAGDVPVSFFALPPLPPSGPAAALPLVPLARAAAAQLSARWMRAVVGTADGSEAARVRGVARLFETAVAAAGDVDAVPDAPRPGPALSVSLSWTGAPTVRITRPVDRMMVPRVLTGALSIAGGGSAPVRLASFAARGARIEVDVTGLTAVTTPRVLTSEGLAPAVSAYAAEGGVIVAPLHGDTSVWIGEDGTCKPHLSWPRTMVGQAAMGEGAVAWSNGTEAWPECGPAYVMYRTTVDGPVTVQLLPFRPTAGAWFDGHLYWNTFRHGLGRWRPDAQPELLLADRSFCGLVSGDDGLALAPCTRDQEGRVVRQVQTQGWQLAAAGAWVPVALAAEGAVTSRAAGPDGWTATAFPDVDLVAFERPGRRIDVTCHYPMTLAWAGRSLVICTAPGDVLLFERLADTLASLA
ncbi:MAG TPA: hypothetical protein VMW48_15805, partial [Vicinamibacterales bacterium]|nr:hypothetical protein [Vicinamibacterales bacterium]